LCYTQAALGVNEKAKRQGRRFSSPKYRIALYELVLYCMSARAGARRLIQFSPARDIGWEQVLVFV